MADENRSASFVVRLRIAPGDRRAWWGEVQHVESGERIAFRDDPKLLQFLQRHLDRLRDAGVTGVPGSAREQDAAET